MAPPRGKPMTKLNALMFALVIEEFQAGPTTAKGLAEATGLSADTVGNLLAAMHKRGVIRVSAWERDTAGRVAVRVFSLEPGRDATKPKKTKPEVNRDYAQRLKAREMAGCFAFQNHQGAAATPQTQHHIQARDTSPDQQGTSWLHPA